MTVGKLTTHPVTGGTLKLPVTVPVRARATVALLKGSKLKRSLPRTAAFTGAESLGLSLKGIPAGTYTLKVSVSATDRGAARVATTAIDVKR